MPGVVQPGIVGARESLSDLIFTYDEGNHPFFRLVHKGGPIRNEVHQHQADKRASANKRGWKDNTPSGAAASMTKDRALVESLPHWFRQPISTGKKAELINDVAGIGKGKLYANELKKAMDAMKDAVEQVLCDDTDCRDEGVNGSETRGLGSWIQTAAQTNRPVPAAYRAKSGLIHAGTAAEFTETKLRTMGAVQYALCNNRKRMVLLSGIELKVHISDWSRYSPTVEGFTQTRSLDKAQKDKVLQAIVDIVETDGCTYEVLPSNHLARSRDGDTNAEPATAGLWRGYLIDPDAWSLAVNQNFEHIPLPEDGGGKRGELQAIVTLCGTPITSGKIAPSDKT
jgi:hypothetical protein